MFQVCRNAHDSGYVDTLTRRRENQATETVWSRDLIKRASNWGDIHGGTLVARLRMEITM